MQRSIILRTVPHAHSEQLPLSILPRVQLYINGDGDTTHNCNCQYQEEKPSSYFVVRMFPFPDIRTKPGLILPFEVLVVIISATVISMMGISVTFFAWFFEWIPPLMHSGLLFLRAVGALCRWLAFLTGFLTGLTSRLVGRSWNGQWWRNRRSRWHLHRLLTEI